MKQQSLTGVDVVVVVVLEVLEGGETRDSSRPELCATFCCASPVPRRGDQTEEVAWGVGVGRGLGEVKRHFLGKSYEYVMPTHRRSAER